MPVIPVQGYLQLDIELEANLGYMRPYLKRGVGKKKGNKKRGQPHCLTRVTAFVRLAPVNGVTTRKRCEKTAHSQRSRRNAHPWIRGGGPVKATVP